MKKYMFAHKGLFVSIIILGILAQGIATSISFYLMYVIDSIASGSLDNLITSAYIGIGVIILFYVLLWSYTKLIVFYQYKSVLKLKNEVFSAILNIKISDFNQVNSGKYISIINNDIQMINDKYFGGILESVKFIINIIFALIAMAFLSPVNALIALALSSSPLILPIIFGKKLAKVNMTYMNKIAILNEKVKDFLMGFEVIKTFGIEKNINKKFFKSAQETEKAHYKASVVSVKLGSLSGTFIIATNILTYLIAGYFAATGLISIGAVVAIAGLNGSISGPMQYLSINIANIKSTKEVRKSLISAMHPKDNLSRLKEANFDNDIKIKNLSYSYDETEIKSSTISKPTIKMIPANGKNIDEILADLGIDKSQATILDGSNMQMPSKKPKRMAIKDLTYNFKANGKYAIVGGSGSGKSTLVRLLMGYYDNYIGSITIGEHEIRDINRESLYKSLSMMHQNVFMLDDTLYNNITLFNPYTQEEYNHAIKNASLTDFAIHQGNIGEGGNTLSGGERQRVAIARAIIKGSKIVMLDEATANLDNETAYDVEKALLDTNELGLISVTHRYTKELLKMYDNILVMRGGELVEYGTFDELYEQKGYFFSLYNVGGE